MKKPRVLFVDDEPHVLDGLQRALRSRNGSWDMVFQVSPFEAIAEQRRAPFDVAVVDMRMPEMSGVELIKALTAQCVTTTAIVLTGATDIESAIAAINEANVFRFYAKPCAADVLASGIDLALAQAKAAPPSSTAANATTFGLATLDRLPMGVVVVDAQATILFMNSQGTEYLAGNDGLTMSPSGLCRASRPTETAELHRLVKLAVDIKSEALAHALAVTREESDRPLSVVIAPLPAEHNNGRVAVLLISDPERQSLPSADTVAKLFDLTDAEARLALALSEGQRIEDAAEQLGITLNSARTYLKRIFSKTDVTRQAELVRLILAAPTLLNLGATKRPLRTPQL
ncbi:MAG TPA: DNA-binding response regulator [Telmatospirillum sp.]|nr:DNA-binding response regulator [Telmatospirillum sp.]